MQASVEQPGYHDRELRVRVGFDPETLRLEHTLIGVVVHLADCPTAGQPGAPALPVRVLRIALPRGMRSDTITVEAGEATQLDDDPVPVAPLQPLRAGASDRAEVPAYYRPEEQRWEGRDPANRGRSDCDDDYRSMVQPLPMPPYVAPDPELYAAAFHRPSAQLIRTETGGTTPMAIVAIHPVRFTDDGHLEFTATIDVTVRFESTGEIVSRKPPHIRSRAQALRDITLDRRTVINPEFVLDYTDLFPIELFSTADYLIITDNNRWDAATQTPSGPVAGDIVASFDRLAAWKRQRGLMAKVATISDIVGGRWGNFRTGSRDLQETLRNFLKMAQAEWGVAWVLLGGDTSIVPVRHAAGGVLGGVARQAIDPPPENTSVWSADHLRMHIVNIGDWWGASIANQLVRMDDGRLIPYDAAGTSNTTTPGWYFTTGPSYATRTAMPTQFVRVNGPAELANADLQFLYMWNTIPTDLYYSSLVGPQYNQSGRHDWDLVDNAIYGQSLGTGLDGVNYTPTVSLGRAPVSTAVDADAFVNKVIAYEKFERPDGAKLAQDWPERVVLVSENWDSSWGGRIWIGSTAANPPGANRYHHAAGANHSIIRLDSMPDWNRSLICYVAEDDARLLPYRTDAAAAGRGWCFARSATDLSPNMHLVFTPTGILQLPMPSQWLAVYGAAEELSPDNYILNSLGADGSLVDQEQLRAQLGSHTGFGARQRLYEDIHDMTPAQLAAGPVEVLSSGALHSALNAGPHIVSLSGHGNSNGCCRLDSGMAGSLTNGFHSFIAYADSCLTNQFDSAAMSERLLSNPNGGAVAYIGSTRFSWIGVGDDFQRLFFRKWATLGGNAHIGLLADTRATLLDSWGQYSRWVVLSLNLMGCPEMPLWWRSPLILRPPQIDLYELIKVRFDPNPPDPPYRIDQPYLDNWHVTHVHVRQGRHEQLLTVRGDRVDARLEGFSVGMATVTIARAGYAPVVRSMRIRRRPTSHGDRLLVTGLLATGVVLLRAAIAGRRRR